MNLQLATARLGVLLTAQALEAGRHLLPYTSSRGSTVRQSAPLPHPLSKECTSLSKPPGLCVLREEPGLWVRIPDPPSS